MSKETEKILLQKIESIGFSPYEAKVFLVLYKGYKMSAAEIAKHARIPRTSVYNILSIFAKKGICNEVDTPTKKIYEVIDKKVLEDKVVIETEIDFKKKLQNVKDCFNELSPIYKTEQPPEYNVDVELIRGYNKQREQKFLDLVKYSKKVILIMNRLWGNVSNELDDESLEFFKRGGNVKSIYEASDNFKIKINGNWQRVSHESLIKLCESFIAQGEHVKLIDHVPQMVAIFDEKIVYLRLYDENIPDKDSSDIIIKNKNFAQFITNLFNLYWDKAETIDTFKKQILNNLNKIN